VSVRNPADPSKYFLARSMAPALVGGTDILSYDLDSNPLDANGRVSYASASSRCDLQGAPDVMSVVHAHTPAVIPFGVSDVRLQPIFHMAAFLGAGVPVFEIRDAGGPATDLLVKNLALGDALARTLGSANVALMRGHGMVTVAGSIPSRLSRLLHRAGRPLEATRCGSAHRSSSPRTKRAAQLRRRRAWYRAPGSCGSAAPPGARDP